MGRPKLIATVEELEQKINDYWEYCEKKERPLTMSGLALYMGIDRTTLINYGKDQEYFNTVKKARDRVEAYTEEQLHLGKNQTGVIFSLKNNWNWKDKQELEQTVTSKKLSDLMNDD